MMGVDRSVLNLARFQHLKHISLPLPFSLNPQCALWLCDTFQIQFDQMLIVRTSSGLLGVIICFFPHAAFKRTVFFLQSPPYSKLKKKKKMSQFLLALEHFCVCVCGCVLYLCWLLRIRHTSVLFLFLESCSTDTSGTHMLLTFFPIFGICFFFLHKNF